MDDKKVFNVQSTHQTSYNGSIHLKETIYTWYFDDLWYFKR